MAGLAKLIVGANLIIGGAVLAAFTGGGGAVISQYMISAGAGLVISGVGTMIAGNHNAGFATASRNPITPWRYVYGQQRVGGALVYLNSWGTGNKMLDLVLVLAAHPCESIDAVLFDQQHIALDATKVTSPGAGAGYARPTFGGSSYTPVQQSGDRAVPISTIQRVNDVVKVTCDQNIPSLIVGDPVIIQDSNGGSTLTNAKLVGKFTISEILVQMTGSLVFTYLCGGLPVTITSGSPPNGDTGQVSTAWVNYGTAVYVEYMLGNQCVGEAFNGMVSGMPWKGTSQLAPPILVDPSLPNNGTAGEATGWVGSPNPWNNLCSLAGKTAIFLRLTYDPNFFSAGIPQISFIIHGKNDIYDPRLGSFGTPGTCGYTDNAALCIADFIHMGAPNGAQWDAGTTYAAGQIASYANVDYISSSDSNTGNEPDATPSDWTPVYNPTTWQQGGNTYAASPITWSKGALVCYGDPNQSAWNSGTTYGLGAVAIFPDPQTYTNPGNSGIPPIHQYVSLASGNLNNNPALSPTKWIRYDGAIEYVSLVNSNSNNKPSTSPSQWRLVSGVSGAPYLAFQPIPVGYSAQYIDPTGTLAPPWNSINIPALITAANICDEQVDLANGGTENRYACDGQFEMTMRRGEILQNMLTSCAGRLVYVGGQYFIQPGYWVGTGSPPLLVDLQAIAAGPYRYWPICKIRDLYNGVKGTYVSPANKWESSDFPYYAQDSLHGYDGPPQYGGDINLAQDGGQRRWLDIHLPFTISYATAQRIAKIELLRRRNYQTSTFSCNMAGYQFVPLDVVEATCGYIGWSNATMEIAAVRFKAERQPSKGGGGSDVIVLGTELDLQIANASTYDWSIAEELSPQGFQQVLIPSASAQETVCYPWSPGYSAPISGDVFEGGQATFGLEPVYGTDNNGNTILDMLIKGSLPINHLYENALGPYITATATSGGSPPSGNLSPGQYTVAVTAFSAPQFSSPPAPYQDTPYLDIATVFVMPSVAAVVGSGGGGNGYFYGDILTAYNGPTAECTVVVTGLTGTGTVSAIQLMMVLDPNIQTASSLVTTGGHGTGCYIGFTVTDTDTGSITVTIQQWGSDYGGDLYLSKHTLNPTQYDDLNINNQTLAQNVFHYQQTLSSAATTVTLTDFDQSTPGGIDTIANHLSVVWQQEIHSGPWAQQIQALTATTITIAGSGMTLNQWAGYTLSLLAKVYNPASPVEVPYLNIPIASSTVSSGGYFTLTVGANALGHTLPNLTSLLNVGDLVTVRGNWTFTSTSFADPNVANGFYPKGDTNVEAGDLAMVLTGADAGDVQTIASITQDGSGNFTVFNLKGAWQVTPSTGDIVVICAPATASEFPGMAFSVPNRNFTPSTVLTVPVQNLLGQTWLFTVRVEDQYGNHCPDFMAPKRDIYPLLGINVPIPYAWAPGFAAPVNGDAIWKAENFALYQPISGSPPTPSTTSAIQIWGNPPLNVFSTAIVAPVLNYALAVVSGGVKWVTQTAGGHNYLGGVSGTFPLTFASGAAAGYAVVVNGVVVNSIVTIGGSGYGSAPAVTYTDPTGNGSGASGTAVLSSGGSIAPGTYQIGVDAFDAVSNPLETPLSNILAVTVTAASSEIALNVTWPVGSYGGNVFVASPDSTFPFHYETAVGLPGPTAGVANYDLTAVLGVYFGAPDPNFDHLDFAVQQEWHSGVWAEQVDAVGFFSLTFTDAVFTSAVVGRVVSLLWSYDQNIAIPIFDAHVTALGGSPPGTTILILDVDPTGIVGVGDLITMRFKLSSISSTQFSDTYATNCFETSGFGTNAETGRVAWIIAGTGAGQQRTINSNASGNGPVTLAEPWDVLPDSTSTLIIVDAAQQKTSLSRVAMNSYANWSGSITTLGLSGFQDTVVVIQGLTANELDEANTTNAPLRELFVPASVQKSPMASFLFGIGGNIFSGQLTQTKSTIQSTATIVSWQANATVASGGQDIQIDVLLNGVSVFGASPATIPIGSTSTITGKLALPVVVNPGDQLQGKIVQAGSVPQGQGITLQIYPS